VPRRRILLCPQFTEVEWTIAPRLSEWAEVATFDAPGVGDEPIPGDDPTRFDREMVVQRALQEVERLDWDSYFVVGDAWGTATAARIANARPAPVLGLALGHASLDYGTEGERAAVNGELVAAMTQLMRSDYDSFVRYG
jgi:pimeloyl-ACP methyl ester carboxylesterase